MKRQSVRAPRRKSPRRTPSPSFENSVMALVVKESALRKELEPEEDKDLTECANPYMRSKDKAQQWCRG